MQHQVSVMSKVHGLPIFKQPTPRSDSRPACCSRARCSCKPCKKACSFHTYALCTGIYRKNPPKLYWWKYKLCSKSRFERPLPTNIMLHASFAPKLLPSSFHAFSKKAEHAHKSTIAPNIALATYGTIDRRFTFDIAPKCSSSSATAIWDVKSVHTPQLTVRKQIDAPLLV